MLVMRIKRHWNLASKVFTNSNQARAWSRSRSGPVYIQAQHYASGKEKIKVPSPAFSGCFRLTKRSILPVKAGWIFLLGGDLVDLSCASCNTAANGI